MSLGEFRRVYEFIGEFIGERFWEKSEFKKRIARGAGGSPGNFWKFFVYCKSGIGLLNNEFVSLCA